MPATVVDMKGVEVFALVYGKPSTPTHCKLVMANVLFLEADGLELDECRRILARNVPGRSHRFARDATEEIVLNWCK